jgi:HAD superfamily hydrolase (TIGR01509 family)
MSFDPSKVQALCFDLDGTLADSDDEFIARAAGWLQPWASRLGLDDGSRWIRRMLHQLEGPKNHVYAWMDRLHLDELLAPLTEGWHRRRSRLESSKNLLIPGIEKMLVQLRARYPLAIVTARGHRNTLNYLETNQIAGYFSVVATARTQRRAKPHPAPVLWAASQLGVNPSNCAMVGDTTLDILAGKRAGAQTVGVLSGFGERADLQRSGADVILESCAQLPEILGMRTD